MKMRILSIRAIILLVVAPLYTIVLSQNSASIPVTNLKCENLFSQLEIELASGIDVSLNFWVEKRGKHFSGLGR